MAIDAAPVGAPLRHIDPAAKLLAAVAVAVVIVTTTGTGLAPFAAYAFLTLGLMLGSGAHLAQVAKKCAVAMPIVVFSALLRAWQDGAPWAALAMASKATIVLSVFAILSASTPLSGLLAALRRLGLPKVAGAVLALMGRYLHVLKEELQRMYRARSSRTSRALRGMERFRREGQLFGALFLRSWHRSDRVYAAMLSRGYTGAWPAASGSGWKAADIAYVLAMTGSFLAARTVL